MRIGFLLILTGNALRLHGALRLFGKDTPILTAGGHLRHPPNYAPVKRLKPVPLAKRPNHASTDPQNDRFRTNAAHICREAMRIQHAQQRACAEKTIIWDGGKQRHRRNRSPCAVRALRAPPVVHVLRFHSTTHTPKTANCPATNRARRRLCISTCRSFSPCVFTSSQHSSP